MEPLAKIFSTVSEHAVAAVGTLAEFPERRVLWEGECFNPAAR